MSVSDEKEPRLETRSRAGWLYAGIWLVYLTIPLVDTFNRKYAVWQQVVGMVGFWVFCYAYTQLVRTTRQADKTTYQFWRGDRYIATLFIGLVALAAALPLLSSPMWVALWIYVSSACGSVLPYERRRAALLGGCVVTAALILEAVLLNVDTGTWAWMVLPSVFSCFAVIGIRRMRSLIDQLHQAREEVKQLAVNDERLRLARDLHDLAGHSMATITLKAELARRLLPDDPERASQQIADIEQVSRQALTDIREAVSGYRRPTLAVETVSARTALEAAQIDFEPDPALLARSGSLGADAEAALAWCLREAVTNVVRHSGATWCRVRLIEARVDGETTLTLEVTDNGRAVPAPGSAGGIRERDGADASNQSVRAGRSVATASAASSNGSSGASTNGNKGNGGQPRDVIWGNGLTGLRERLDPFSATLSAAPLAPHGFRLTATLPIA
jgi:two-component system sensor histidine kinase DesK